MARPGAVYPQVEATAGALMDTRMIACAPTCRVAAALARARGAGARVLVIGHRRAVRERDLSRAERWHLGDLRVAALAWHGLPTLAAGAPEVEARRLVREGSPLVVVRGARRVLGVIDAERVEIAPSRFSLVHRLDRVSEAVRWFLGAAGDAGERLGVRVFAVGGFVRDLLLDRSPYDVDLLVEGDGVAFARRLCEEVGGRLTVHPDFGTASLEGVNDAAGVPLGRVDVASARRERYDAPGTLPAVSEASAEEDLRRRDFTVNAMAMALAPSAFGRLLDPLGGRLDLERRRLRPLSPLSFVEDPTRIFRAARYAARLGFRLDATGRRALGLALEIGAYPALSGARLRAELDLLVAESSGDRALELLLKWKALSLWDRGYRHAAPVARRVRAGARLRRWAEGRPISINPAEVALVALLVDQDEAVVGRCLARLGVTGRPRGVFLEAARSAPLGRRLDRPTLRRPSEAADVLEQRPPLVLAAAWLLGGRRARRWIQWLWTRGRAVRPLLTGDDVVALGVPRGPAVGKCLAALRRCRLDGAGTTRGAERAFVRAWLGEPGHLGTGADDGRRAGARRAARRAPAIGRASRSAGRSRTILEGKERCV